MSRQERVTTFRSPGPLGRANGYKKGYLKDFEQVGELSRSCERILISERYNKRAL